MSKIAKIKLNVENLYKTQSTSFQSPIHNNNHAAAVTTIPSRDIHSLSHLLGDVSVEGEHPEAENQLVLTLEVDARAEHREERRDAVHPQEGVPILVDA